MKRGIQGVTRREQPKLPITMSVASAIVLESLRNSQKYNLHFREISWGLIRTEKCADLVTLWLSLNVLFEPDTCRSLASCEGQECRITCRSRPAICTHTFGHLPTFMGNQRIASSCVIMTNSSSLLAEIEDLVTPCIPTVPAF
jgi:hypothetical protein